MNENDILMESLGITSDELATIDPERLEKEMENGGVMPDGLYHVQVIGVASKTANSGTQGYEIEYEVIGGPFKGSKVKDTLWKGDKTKNRLTLFGHRMGLLTEVAVSGGSGGKKQWALAPGMTGWGDVRGWAGVIEIVIEEYEQTDKVTHKPNGKKGKANRVTFGGCYRDNDPKCKDVVRGTPAAIGNPAVRNLTSAAATAAPVAGVTTSALAIDPYAAAGI